MSQNNNPRLTRDNDDVMNLNYITSEVIDSEIEDEVEEDDTMNINETSRDPERSRARTSNDEPIDTPEGSNYFVTRTWIYNTHLGNDMPSTSSGQNHDSRDNRKNNTTKNKRVPSGKDDEYFEMIKELTTEEKIVNRIRLPIHPSACVVCRLCLFCSHKHGQAACACASLNAEGPKKGYTLPPFMAYSRVISSDYVCPTLGKFTIDWIERNAHKVYQPLHFAKAIPTGFINVCSTHSSKYYSDCRNIHGDAKDANRLSADSVEYQLYENEKRRISYPSGILQYISDKGVGWDQSKVDMHKKRNKLKFHLLCLDTCESITIDEEKIIGRSTEAINGKRKATDMPEKRNRKRKQKKGSSSTEEDPDTIIVFIWNAPSMETHSLNVSYGSPQSPILLHLIDFGVADKLIRKNIKANKRETFRNVLNCILKNVTSVDSSQLRLRFVKDYELDINIDSALNQYPNKLFNGKHLDLYIGSYVRR